MFNYTYIGSYTIERFVNIFTDEPVSIFYHKGVEIAVRTDGVWNRYKPDIKAGCEWTRAKGFRYWKKYYPDRRYDDLPEELQRAIDMKPRAWGRYTSKKDGAYIGFEG